MGRQQVGPPALPPTDCDSSSQRGSPWEPPTLRPAAPRSLEAGVVLRKASGSVHHGSGDPEGETSAPGGRGGPEANRQVPRGICEQAWPVTGPAHLPLRAAPHSYIWKDTPGFARMLILMRPGWSES